MNRYTITFTGRRIGAIGSTYHDVVEVLAENEREAINKLYDTHEHISFPSVSQPTPVKQTARV